jgi:hypothetical protein
MTTANCFTCGRPGHWAKDCDTGPCPKCRVPLILHTDAGMAECAWRGQSCVSCGFPPHPDGARACPAYEHPDDTGQWRQIRAATARHRSTDPDCWYRRANRRPPDPAGDPAGTLMPWRDAAERLMTASARLGSNRAPGPGRACREPRRVTRGRAWPRLVTTGHPA